MWNDVSCICFVGDSSKMDTDSATNAVKEEHLPVEETCLGLKITNVRSLSRDADGSCTTECVSGDWSAEVKQENCTVIKQVPDDVCCIVLIPSRISLIKSYLQGCCRSQKVLEF